MTNFANYSSRHHQQSSTISQTNKRSRVLNWNITKTNIVKLVNKNYCVENVKLNGRQFHVNLYQEFWQLIFYLSVPKEINSPLLNYVLHFSLDCCPNEISINIEKKRDILWPFLPTPLVTQSRAFRFAGLAVLTTMCCISRQVRLGLASRARAQIPAARGADAEVPVWLLVHWWCKSVVTTCFSPVEPELYVVARVDEQASLYHGTSPFSVALLIDNVHMLFV